MKALIALLSLGLAACGNQPANQSADAAANSRPGAVTAEAVADTQAAEADALKAADAELDNLSNSIDNTDADDAKTGVSNTTKVEVY